MSAAIAWSTMSLVSVTTGCAPRAGGGEPTEREESAAMSDTTIEAAQQELTDSLMSKPGVVGTAIGLCDDVPCIRIFLARRNEALLAIIPETFRGYKVDVQVTGEFRARDTT
jgi:hypothetical protein